MLVVCEGGLPGGRRDMRTTPIGGRGGRVVILLITSVASFIVGHVDASSSFPKRIPIGNASLLLYPFIVQTLLLCPPIVSDIAAFVLKMDVKLQLTNSSHGCTVSKQLNLDSGHNKHTGTESHDQCR